MLPATRNYVPWTTHLRSEEPPVSPTEQLRALLRSVPSPPPGDIQTEQIPALKNYLEPCRLVLSPVLLHEAHDALVANAEALLQAIITKFPTPPAFNKSLPSVIRNITTALNSALPNAQLQAHIDDGVTLYLNTPTSESLLALAMPHSHSDDEVTALLASLNSIHVNGAVSPCPLQPVLNNLLLLMTHHDLEIALLTNHSSTILLRRSYQHPPLTPLVEVSRVVKVDGVPEPLLSNSLAGLALGAVCLAMKERGVPFGYEEEWEMLKKLWPSSRY